MFRDIFSTWRIICSVDSPGLIPLNAIMSLSLDWYKKQTCKQPKEQNKGKGCNKLTKRDTLIRGYQKFPVGFDLLIGTAIPIAGRQSGMLFSS